MQQPPTYPISPALVKAKRCDNTTLHIRDTMGVLYFFLCDAMYILYTDVLAGLLGMLGWEIHTSETLLCPVVYSWIPWKSDSLCHLVVGLSPFCGCNGSVATFCDLWWSALMLSYSLCCVVGRGFSFDRPRHDLLWILLHSVRQVFVGQASCHSSSPCLLVITSSAPLLVKSGVLIIQRHTPSAIFRTFAPNLVLKFICASSSQLCWNKHRTPDSSVVHAFFIKLPFCYCIMCGRYPWTHTRASAVSLPDYMQSWIWLLLEIWLSQSSQLLKVLLSWIVAVVYLSGGLSLHCATSHNVWVSGPMCMVLRHYT